jgi:hypothetical protein
MKRNEIVKTLLKEGFSEKTLVGFSDKQLSDLHERIFGEQVTPLQPKQPALKIGPKGGELPASQKGYTISQNPVDKSIIAVAKESEVSEEKPSAGLSKEKKSEVVKKAKKGEDIGKKGKGFEKVVAKAKEGGAKDPESVAAAAMWKNIKRENVEVKNWLETIAEDNFHSFTSKGEIMELIQIKLNEVEVGPNVKKGHNGVPEFMSYDAISNTEVKEAAPTTKPAPTKPKVDPGTKPKTPYSPKPGEKSKPKALKEKENANK